MNKVNVTIHVVASGVSGLDFDPARDGKTKSTGEKINVIKVNDGYSVVFDDVIFASIPLSKLATSLVQLFSNNVPDTIFNFQIKYHYETPNDTYFDYDTAKHVLDLDDMMIKIDNSKKIPVFQYTRLDDLDGVYSDFRDEEEFNLSDDDESDDDDDNADYVDYDIDDDDGILSFLSNDTKPSKVKKYKEYYGRSRCFKNSKQPKKQIKRHGVLIADKDDIKHDEKVIKEFLKDFIPGDASWKKEFRSDVLNRWMSMYAISKKTLKQLEKQNRKNRKSREIKTERMINFADKLFAVPLDRWNDPTK